MVSSIFAQVLPRWLPELKGRGNPVDGGKVVLKIGEGFPIVWPEVDLCRVKRRDSKGQRKVVLLWQVSVKTPVVAAEWNLLHVAMSRLWRGLQLEPPACWNNVTSDGIKKRDPVDRWIATQTQVPWCAGGRAFRLFKAWDLSLKSVGFCCEMSISALATMSPKEGKRKNQKNVFN